MFRPPSFVKAVPLLAAFAFVSHGFAQEAAKAQNPSTDSETASATSPKPDSGKKARTVSIEMRDGLRFEPPRFEAQPGEEVVISLENADTTHQPHNFLILQPGKREAVVQQALGLGEKGPAVGYIPTSPDIIVHSELLNPEGTNSVRVTMPTQKGVYPYVCTMPGHGMVMYGAIYVGTKMPTLSKDPNIPPQAAQHAVPGGGQRPYIQRTFLPNTGPASIAVALPGEQSYCWDAGECRLRYAWRGAFIDTSANWRGNGKDLAVLASEPWWKAEVGDFPLKFVTVGNGRPAVKFLGYKLDGGLPEFHYRIGDTEIFEKITPLPDNAGLADHFRLSKAPVQLRYEANSNAIAAPESTRSGSAIIPAHPTDFTITITESASSASHSSPVSSKP